ncbi:MAG: hypothetical protein ACLFUP_08390 [Desulfobacteraceae bacterium]
MGTDLSARAEDIRRWSEAPVKPIELRLIKGGDKRSLRIEAFLKELVSLAPALSITEENVRPGALPGFRLQGSWMYHAVPEGRELTPFLELIERIASGDPGVKGPLRKTLEAASAPSNVDLYVAVQCPNCPEVVRRISPFPMVNPAIKVRITDAVLFPGAAEEKSIRAVPTVLCGRGFRFTGQVGSEEVAKALLQGDVGAPGPDSLSRMIKAGDAQGLAAMMLERKAVFPGLVDLLAGEELSLRLGAMVAMEELGEKDPDLAGEALEALWERLPESGHAAKGDIVYLIGRLGGHAWVPRLKSLLEQEHHQELREALEEALDVLHAHSRR